MISSTVTNNIKRSIGTYPRLVNFPTEGITVLLTGKTTTGGVSGVIVGTGSATFKVGESSDAWKEDQSIDLDGAVTLQNA